MVEVITVVAVLLLVAGVIGAAVPGAPGPPLSVLGVLLSWWGSGFTEPGPWLLAGLVGIGVIATVADWAVGAVSARLGGASLRTTVAAGGVGFVFLVFAGPLAALAGVVLTLLVLEVRRHGDLRSGSRTVAVTVLGLLGSLLVQVLLTGTILVVFVAAVVL